MKYTAILKTEYRSAMESEGSEIDIGAVLRSDPDIEVTEIYGRKRYAKFNSDLSTNELSQKFGQSCTICPAFKATPIPGDPSFSTLSLDTD